MQAGWRKRLPDIRMHTAVALWTHSRGLLRTNARAAPRLRSAPEKGFFRVRQEE